jgi:tRNA pseudouridine55 synthase
VDKPAGPSSHDAVSLVRSALGTRRVGHAGTLDPPATGLLVVLVGRATRLSRFIALLPKRYAGTVRFGYETATDDAEGEPTERDPSFRSRSLPELSRALAAVASRATQVPPAVSAKKVDGRRAYRAARRGHPMTLPPVQVAVYQARVTDVSADGTEVGIEVECSAGTYVRALARDLGRELSTRAHLSSLRRTGIGPWSVDRSLPLGAAAADLRAALRPMREAVAHLPAVEVPADLARRLGHGQKLPAAAAGAELPAGRPLAVVSGAELIAVAWVRDGLLAPEVVLIG